MLKLLFVCCLSAVLLSACAAGSWAASVGKQIESYFAVLPSLWPEGDTSVSSGSMLPHLSGDGAGVWHVILADGKVTAGQGEIENPTVTIGMAALTGRQAVQLLCRADGKPFGAAAEP